MNPPRLIFNDDGCNFLVLTDSGGPEEMRAYLGWLANSHVDMVAYCVTFGGGITYYESEFAELIGSGYALSEDVRYTRWSRNLQRFRDAGTEYIGFVFQTLREKGIAPVASFRMNDAHMSGDPTGPCAGRFWMAHPEWRLGEPYGYYAACLDYAVPEVREHLRLLVREVVHKYPDIAGIELDGLRSPFFFKDGTGEANAPLLTGLIRQIRQDLDSSGAIHRAGRGESRRYRLHVNVPRTPELALRVGMDVAAWEAEGLVDSIAPGCYDTDFAPATAEWKRVLKTTPVLPYLNCSPATGEYMSLEDYRGAAANAWATGADGIYLFNMPCLDELCMMLPREAKCPPFPPPEFRGTERFPDLARSRQAVHELGDPEALKGRSKRFLFAMEKGHYYHQTRQVLSLRRLTETSMELTWDCYEDYAAASAITLEFKLVSVSLYDRFVFALNGHELAEDRFTHLYASNGRDARFSSRPLAPYGLYKIALEPRELQRGHNVLRVTLTERDPVVLGAVDLMEVVVEVRYAEG